MQQTSKIHFGATSPAHDPTNYMPCTYRRAVNEVSLGPVCTTHVYMRPSHTRMKKAI